MLVLIVTFGFIEINESNISLSVAKLEKVFIKDIISPNIDALVGWLGECVINVKSAISCRSTQTHLPISSQPTFSSMYFEEKQEILTV